MLTPGKPRQSSIPAPSQASGIPTPRSRSTSSAGQHGVVASDVEFMSRAFADAIKANDPAQHRPNDTNAVASSSSSLTPQLFASGRRSVTSRISPATSSTSAASSARAKTPSVARPPSRQSDIFGRSSSRTGKAYDVGDNVRIESLGYEGTLRYIGEIDGKLGLWAGVELSGGFSGKGKNDGSVNGKQYFVCPTDCGVFVAITKLSAPTVGTGSVYRPSSVASSRSERMSSSGSGRMTPSSLQTGRVTPSMLLGRVTPGLTPSTRPRSREHTKPVAITPDLRLVSDASKNKITVGTRASHYASMTAKELNTRESRDSNEKTQHASSPTGSIASMSGTSTSPTRSPVSIFNTPKPRIYHSGPVPGSNLPSKSRSSLNTPRGRIPSAISMPPPASPVALNSSHSTLLWGQSSTSISTDAYNPLSGIELNGKSLQGQISNLTSGTVFLSTHSSPRLASVTSLDSSIMEQSSLSRLESRLDALEYENEQLRPIGSDYHDRELAETLQRQSEAGSRISDLEKELTKIQGLLADREATITSSEVTHRQTITDLELQKDESSSLIQDLQTKLDLNLNELERLKVTIEEKERVVLENTLISKAKDAELASMEAQLHKAHIELEAERIELSAQIAELRQAGQETIALYEERLSEADSQRYELESRVAMLETEIRQTRPSSPALSSSLSPASRIDNESLREQLHHMQKKIATMEDVLEDARANAEKEEAALRERMARLKEKEDIIKKEALEQKRNFDRMAQSEASARARVEEIEEALRESTVALENARAEVEILRAEFVDLDSVVSAGDDPENFRLTSSDKVRLNDEVVRLRKLLEEAHGINPDTTQFTTAQDRRGDPLVNEKVEMLHEDYEAKLVNERKLVADLRLVLNERSVELDSLKKKINRDVPVNGTSFQEGVTLMSSVAQSPLLSKYDISAAREEITGLKHIVQELQKENIAATQQNKILTSENRLLLSETRQLRQKVEDDHGQRNSKEIGNIRDAYPPAAEDQGFSKELKLRYENDLEQLKKRLAEAELKNARTSHDLNKEISELEALVESKIYREDELEQELERIKDKLARMQKKASKNGAETAPFLAPGSTKDSASPSSDVCEICERPGHDIFNCDLLKDDTEVTTRLRNSSSDLFCEDCESRGHLAADCPHSLDVF